MTATQQGRNRTLLEDELDNNIRNNLLYSASALLIYQYNSSNNKGLLVFWWQHFFIVHRSSWVASGGVCNWKGGFGDKCVYCSHSSTTIHQQIFKYKRFIAQYVLLVSTYQFLLFILVLTRHPSNRFGCPLERMMIISTSHLRVNKHKPCHPSVESNYKQIRGYSSLNRSSCSFYPLRLPQSVDSLH